MFEPETFEHKTFDEKAFDEEDFSHKFPTQALTSKSGQLRASDPKSRAPEDPKQRRMMLAALALLMLALCIVLYRDRDFWFPGAEEAQLDEPAVAAPVSAAPATPAPATSAPVAAISVPAPVAKSKTHATAAAARTSAGSGSNTTETAARPAVDTDADLPPAVVSNRTVLPPLEVEVVAGDKHRTLRPGTNSVRVDLQPGTAPQHTVQPATQVPTQLPNQLPNQVALETPANATATIEAPEIAAVTNSAAERVQMSADTEEVVRNPVKPGYPLLARQMKVQGSVILRALIGKDGLIQDLHVLSGPHILAAAAQDAVRQWRFKPHFVGDEAVETQAKITVNFTISTN